MSFQNFFGDGFLFLSKELLFLIIYLISSEFNLGIRLPSRLAHSILQCYDETV